MSSRIMKAFRCLLVALLLSGLVNAVFGLEYYPSSSTWEFPNDCYLGFNRAMNFTCAPHLGVSYDDSLVGYWSLNEGSGLAANDSSGDGNNGILVNSPTWVTGKFGNALRFNNSFVSVGTSSSLTLSSVTISLWAKREDNGSYQNLVSKTYSSFRLLFWTDGNLCFDFTSDGKEHYPVSTTQITDSNLHFLAVTFDAVTGNYVFYVDGVVAGSGNTGMGSIEQNNQPLVIGARDSVSGQPFNGVIDEVRLYNRALSATEIAASYAQPDSLSLENYYNYKDPITNNTMLIHVDNPNANGNNVAVVTCTNFFAGNRLAFQANNTATVNVWTNLRKPAFTTGVWNSQNYTTTLTLDASSTGELNWNTHNITTYADAHSGVSPSNATVGDGGSQTLNFNASQGYRFNVAVDGVSRGQVSSYTFSNVTEPHIVNVTSIQLFTIVASAGGNGSITPSGLVVVDYSQIQKFNFTANTGYHVSKVLVDNVPQSIADSYTFSNVQKNHTISVSFDINTYNITTSSDAHSNITPGNVIVDYGGNQQFNITTDSGYISRVYVDGVDQGNVTSYAFTNIKSNHTISVTSSALIPTSVTNPNDDPEPDTSANSTSTSTTSQTNQFPTETIAIIAVAITILIAGFTLALKKGYIKIEVVEEPGDQPEDPL